MNPAAIDDWSALARIREAPLLLVSPHLDDAWLSCSAILGRPEPIHVLAVFAGAPPTPVSGAWDAACGFADSTTANAARRAEGRQAFAATGHRLEMMDLLEAQYLVGERDPRDMERLGLVARDWLRSHPAGVVLGPVGAGVTRSPAAVIGRVLRRGNLSVDPDHGVVRDTLAGAVPPRSLLLYEEFPHRRGRRGDAAAARVGRRRGEYMAPADLAIDRRRKAGGLANYPSQLRGLCGAGPQFSDPRNLDADERYWLPTP